MKSNFLDWKDVPLVMGLKIAAELLGVSYDTVKRKAQNQAFPAFKAGNAWKVTKEDLLKYIEGLKKTEQGE